MVMPTWLAIAWPICVSPERDTRNGMRDRKSTRLNSSHLVISYAVFCLKKKNELDSLRHPRVFHIWWHDHTLGGDMPKRMARVAQVLDMVAERCQVGRAHS